MHVYSSLIECIDSKYIPKNHIKILLFLACNDLSGGWFDETPDCPGGFQFEPPAPGLGGYGEIVSGKHSSSRKRVLIFINICFLIMQSMKN